MDCVLALFFCSLIKVVQLACTWILQQHLLTTGNLRLAATVTDDEHLAKLASSDKLTIILCENTVDLLSEILAGPWGRLLGSTQRLTVLYTGQRQVATDQTGFPQPH